ncbi:MAG: RNA polymerase sporulation sigma factor SigF [Firmicutes bacterium HGW-Firmicutes-1]|nr:MAG: RNA polymerase sporulation sigma factor SigF [Firmicutes bacterium HGW-Firmicutes-1]
MHVMNKGTLQLIIHSQEGHLDARETLVKENIGLIWSIVRRFSNRGYELDDLFQIGCIGLLKAIDKFDLSYQVQFSTYAVPMIIGEIKRFIRDDGMIKVSRSLKEMGSKARITREVLNNQYGREPTIEEIAGEIGSSVEEVVMALESATEVESLHKTIYQGDGNPIYLLDKIKSLEDESSKMVDLLALREIMAELAPKEKEIILLRYFQDKTQTEIAARLGISQVQVSRLEKKILENMKKKLS